MGPRVSVLLPVHNGQAYIATSIQSILSQSFQDFELIVLDDGSTDETRLIVGSFRDKRIIYVDGPREGLAATLNKGIGLARAPLIARQDADDISLPCRLKRQLDYFDNHPDCVLLGTWATIINEYGHVIGSHRHPCRDQELRLALCFSNPFVHTSVIFLKSAAKQAGGYPTNDAWSPPEDYALWTRLAEYGAIANINKELVAYCSRSTGVSRIRAGEIRKNSISIASEYISKCAGKRIDAELAAVLSRYLHGYPYHFNPNQLPIVMSWPSLLIDKTGISDTNIRRIAARQWLKAIVLQLPGQKTAKRLRHGFSVIKNRVGGKRISLHVESELKGVSVVIATHGRPEQLHHAITSALSQNHDPYEILVCEDGATDATAAVVRSFNDPRVIYLPGIHSGLPAAPRNRGIRAAKGKWLAFLDDDDSWQNDKLAVQLEAAHMFQCGFIATQAHDYRSGEERSDKPSMLDFADLAAGNPILLSSVLVQRRLVAAGFSEQQSLRGIEDYHLWLQVAIKSKCCLVQQPLTLYSEYSSDSIRLKKSKTTGVDELCNVLRLFIKDHPNIERIPLSAKLVVARSIAFAKAKEAAGKVIDKSI